MESISLFWKNSFVGDLLLLFWRTPLKTSQHYYIYYADIILFYNVFMHKMHKIMKKPTVMFNQPFTTSKLIKWIKNKKNKAMNTINECK